MAKYTYSSLHAQYAQYLEPIGQFNCDPSDTDDGYWFYIRAGFCCDASAALHTIHEDTLAQCEKCMREIEPCDCSECVPEKQTKITVETRKPITAYYNATGVIPHRLVVYRVVKIIPNMPSYGLITLDKKTHIVIRKLTASGNWGNWATAYKIIPTIGEFSS